MAAAGHAHFLGVDEVDGGGGGHIAHKACCGVDVERTAHNDEDVGLGSGLGSVGQAGHGLAEPHYPGAQKRTVGGALAMGIAVGKSSEAMARQPEATSQIRTTMMMGLVFIETVIIYALIVAILIIFVL